MRRRNFIAGLAGAVAWPIAARAQQPVMPVIGFLQSGSPEGSLQLVAAFKKGLSEMGFAEGRNLAIEYRYAQNQLDRLPELATELVHHRVAVIATLGSDLSAAAAKAATTSIPIVFEVGGDPAKSGLVSSLSRPGGNLTGVTSMNAELSAKRLGLLHDLVPQAQRFAALVNRNSAATEVLISVLEVAARPIGVQIEIYHASTIAEIDTAFASLVQKGAEAVLSGAGPPFSQRQAQLVTLASRYALPAIYPYREAPQIGGLMSYATSFDRYRQAGLYTGRILKGEKTAELPVMLPTKFEFVINLQAAKLIGITVPPTLLAQADEVIE